MNDFLSQILLKDEIIFNGSIDDLNEKNCRIIALIKKLTHTF